jgi:hypothetical protein
MEMRHGRPAARFDLSPAEEFGQTVFLLDWSDTRSTMCGKESEVLWMLRERLADFCDEDYLLMTGDWTAMALAVTLALEINDGRAKCLQWNRGNRAYDVVKLDLNAQPLSGNGGRAR